MFSIIFSGTMFPLVYNETNTIYYVSIKTAYYKLDQIVIQLYCYNYFHGEMLTVRLQWRMVLDGRCQNYVSWMKFIQRKKVSVIKSFISPCAYKRSIFNSLFVHVGLINQWVWHALVCSFVDLGQSNYQETVISVSYIRGPFFLSKTFWLIVSFAKNSG